jgi:DNA-binding SARP family transcriptional activator
MSAQPAQLGGIGEVRLTLLGGFRLVVGDAVLPVPPAAQRLVAVLALTGPASRARVAGTLWPESPQVQAMTNLRHVMWKLQNAVTDPPPVATTVRGELHLAPWVSVDVQQLVEDSYGLLHEGRLPQDPGTIGVLRSGPCELLPDWDEEWLQDERERLRHLRLHVLESWAEALAQWGRFGLALDVALVALRSDVLRESAHRTVIKVHRLEGNVLEARRAFDTCRRVLAEEMGVTPTAETVALVP